MKTTKQDVEYAFKNLLAMIHGKPGNKTGEYRIYYADARLGNYIGIAQCTSDSGSISVISPLMKPPEFCNAVNWLQNLKRLEEVNMNNKTYYIEARKWFDKINGNTYHSVLIKENGQVIAVNNFEYGYGEQWEYTALMELHKLGIGLDYVVPWQFYESLGRLPSGEFTNVYTVVYNVNRRKDLAFPLYEVKK